MSKPQTQTPSPEGEIGASKEMSIVEVRVVMSRETYKRLIQYILNKYPRVRGHLSIVVEEAVREYLDKHSSETESKSEKLD